MAPMILFRRSWASGRPMPGTAQRAFIKTLPGYGRVLESHNSHRHDLLTAICTVELVRGAEQFGSGYGQQRDPPYKYRSLLAFPRPFLLLPPINTFSSRGLIKTVKIFATLLNSRHHPFNGRRSSNRGGAPDYALYVQ
ncbi:hypothetical protein CBS147343_2542 [Aspergillus niger]|nr:hypothetical protein CBS133816_5562 [Aspergillus niger]KAI2837050.1 hypothetical protein CBS11350_8970 [Aspergillus niger]KAI2887895.1 hypothetical protein CBS11852_7395 [Aspergillus niger]KAI2913348.1 hypothetical protein CBS147371_6979 [Aspergillus niger]KAI2920841.1 hypothetical protein CBS147320_7948 [Aspergillus niger]